MFVHAGRGFFSEQIHSGEPSDFFLEEDEELVLLEDCCYDVSVLLQKTQRVILAPLPSFVNRVNDPFRRSAK